METPTIDEYRDWMVRHGQARSTVQMRVKFAASFLRLWGTWDVPIETLAEWLGGFTGWTRLTYHNNLTSLLDWLGEEAGDDRPNPMRSLKRPKTPRPRPRPLTSDELTRALDAATPEVRAYLLLGVFAGLRAHEIAKLHGSDVSESAVFVVGKGGLEASVPTHPEIWTLAQHYPRDGYWFLSCLPDRQHITAGCVSRAVGRLFRELGIEGASHRARHTYGTRLIRAGVNIRVVQELMRHSSLATTALYLGVTEDEKTAAINSLTLTP